MLELVIGLIGRRIKNDGRISSDGEHGSPADFHGRICSLNYHRRHLGRRQHPDHRRTE
jgi:hypothetical protein